MIKRIKILPTVRHPPLFCQPDCKKTISFYDKNHADNDQHKNWCLCSDFCTRSASRSSPENCHSTHRGEEISFWISYFVTSWTIAGSSLPDTWLKRLDPPASETGTEPESATWLHLLSSKVCCFGCCLPIPLSKGKFHFNQPSNWLTECQNFLRVWHWQ